MRGLGHDVMSTGVQQLDFFYSSIHESLSWLHKLPFLFLDLYVLGDDTSISKGSFMRTKHLFVLIHIRNKGKVGTCTIKHVLERQ